MPNIFDEEEARNLAAGLTANGSPLSPERPRFVEPSRDDEQPDLDSDEDDDLCPECDGYGEDDDGEPCPFCQSDDDDDDDDDGDDE